MKSIDNKKAQNFGRSGLIDVITKEVNNMNNITLSESGVQGLVIDGSADYESFVLTSKNFAEEIQALCAAMLSTGEMNAHKLASVIHKLTSMHLEVCETEKNLMNASFQGVMS